MAWLIGAVLAALLVFAPIMGYLSSPWAAFWVAGSNNVPPAIEVQGEAAASQSAPADPLRIAPHPGMVSDAQRFQLARMAGWTPADAVIATAISLAEDGSGDPAALSGRNSNGTYDLGLWQINSAWWAQFGGQQALVDPWRNAQAAYYIKGRQDWCAWSTYGPCPTHACGPPCYSAFLGRATAASQVQPAAGQA